MQNIQSIVVIPTQFSSLSLRLSAFQVYICLLCGKNIKDVKNTEKIRTEKTFGNHRSDKVLLSRIYKNIQTLILKNKQDKI